MTMHAFEWQAAINEASSGEKEATVLCTSIVTVIYLFSTHCITAGLVQNFSAVKNGKAERKGGG